MIGRLTRCPTTRILRPSRGPARRTTTGRPCRPAVSTRSTRVRGSWYRFPPPSPPVWWYLYVDLPSNGSNYDPGAPASPSGTSRYDSAPASPAGFLPHSGLVGSMPELVSDSKESMNPPEPVSDPSHHSAQIWP